MPSGYAAYGYSGALELLRNARNLGTYPIDSDALSKAIEGSAYTHYKTPQWWRPCDHQSFQDFYMHKIKGPEERTSEDDISEVVGSASWELDFGRDCSSIGHENNLWGHSQDY